MGRFVIGTACRLIHLYLNVSANISFKSSKLKYTCQKNNVVVIMNCDMNFYRRYSVPDLKINIARDSLTMKNLKIALSFAIFLVLPLTASADSCSWTHASVSSGGAVANVVFTCSIGGAVAAVKTVGARATSSSTCSISVTNGFYNSGTCNSPNITTSDPCTNSGAYYGTFWASQWSNHVDAIEAFCGACGYQTVPIWQPGGGEPMLEVSCR